MSRSTRWCPTPEQLMILEELYRGGLRTPKAYQIQKITAHLSLYGKIEGKNVFYWFQNHKARDRQKLRRKLTKQLEHQQLLQKQLYQHQHHNLENPLHHHLDSYPSSVLHQQLPCYNSAGCLPQGRVEDASPRLGDYIWKVNIPTSCEMENHSMIRTYGHDWMMMMMDVSPAISSCTTSRRPLETLSLFPTTATSLKDQSTANEP